MFNLWTETVQRHPAGRDDLSDGGSLKNKSIAGAAKSRSSVQSRSKIKPSSKSSTKTAAASKPQPIKNKAVPEPVEAVKNNTPRSTKKSTYEDRVGFTKRLLEQLNDSLVVDQPSKITDPNQIVDMRQYYHNVNILKKQQQTNDYLKVLRKPEVTEESVKPVDDPNDAIAIQIEPAECSLSEYSSLNPEWLRKFRGKTIPINRDPVKPEPKPVIQSPKKKPLLEKKKKHALKPVFTAASPKKVAPPASHANIMKSKNSLLWTDVRKKVRDDMSNIQEIEKLKEKFQEIHLRKPSNKTEQKPKPARK